MGMSYSLQLAQPDHRQTSSTRWRPRATTAPSSSRAATSKPMAVVAGLAHPWIPSGDRRGARLRHLRPDPRPQGRRSARGGQDRASGPWPAVRQAGSARSPTTCATRWATSSNVPPTPPSRACWRAPRRRRCSILDRHKELGEGAGGQHLRRQGRHLRLQRHGQLVAPSGGRPRVGPSRCGAADRAAARPSRSTSAVG